MENASHWTLVSGSYIPENKRHDCIIKVVHESLKSSLFNIKEIHPDLIITIETILKEILNVQ